jgi:hypothetical protein
MDSRRRRVDGTLRHAVLVADQHCRGINCASPIRDIDHIHPYARGGDTSFTNSQGLSKACHTTRDHPAMQVTADPGSRMTTWHTPTGLTHHSLPPPTLGHGSLTPQQIRLRHWQTHPTRHSNNASSTSLSTITDNIPPAEQHRCNLLSGPQR